MKTIQLNLNDSATIYPTATGFIKIENILREKYRHGLTFDQIDEIDEKIKRRTTEDGGYKDLLWSIMSELGELFFNGSQYLESSKILIEENK